MAKKIQHKMICTPEELGTIMDNLMQHNGDEIHAKQINGISYLVTWETEDEDNAEN